MGITKTVGGNGRDYDRANYSNDDDATIQAALTFFNSYDFSSNGGGPCYIDIYPEGGGTNGEWVLGSGLTGPTGTTNATAANYLCIRAAPGYSFKDHADKATNALRYNRANGVALTSPWSNAGFSLIAVSCNYTKISGLQLSMIGHNYNGPHIVGNSGVNYVSVENCIFRCEGGIWFSGLSGCNVTIVNTLWYGGAISNTPYTSNGTKIINCTAYVPSGTYADYGAARFDYTATGILLQNSLMYSGGSNADVYLQNGASLHGSSGYNGLGDASGGGSTGCVYSITLADLWRNTGSGTEDFRLLETLGSTATGVQAGGTDTTTYTSDLDIVGRTRNATTPTIGAWEYIQSAQLAAPTSDISAGNWLRSSDNTGTGLYTMLDESTYSDADYVYVNSDSTMEVKFASVSDPATASGHKVRYRIKGNGVATITVSLRQGSGTEIASWAHTTASTSVTAYEQTLSSGQADSITDYADLRLRFVTFTP